MKKTLLTKAKMVNGKPVAAPGKKLVYISKKTYSKNPAPSKVASSSKLSRPTRKA